MKMHVLSGGRLRMRKNVFYSDAERSEMLELPVSCYLLRHRQGNVLFDTGCHPSVVTDAEARWGSLARAMVPIFETPESLPNQLAALGLGGDDIDVVVNSHFHPDHCGCNEYFRKATVVCHENELDAARASDADKLGYQRADWDHPQRFQPINGAHDLFGDSRITLIPTPGHTPGCVVAQVQLERSGNFLLASDTVPMRVHLQRDELPRNTWNNDQAARSIGEVRRIERDGATVLFGHDAEQWQTLRKGAESYD